MSTSEPSSGAYSLQQFELYLPPGVEPGDVHMTIYDGKDATRYTGPAVTELRLPPGLYTVRTELAGEVSETVIRLPRPYVNQIKVKWHTPTPLKGTALKHEYYTDPSEKLSRTDTGQPLGDTSSGQSRLFIFIRAIDDLTYQKEDLSEHLKLYCIHNGWIVDFQSDVVRDEQFGYLAFSVRAEPGLYLLECSGATPRHLPLYVYPEWETQVFIAHRQRPLVENATVFHAHAGTGYSASDITTGMVDLALAGLLSSAPPVLPARMQSDLINQKFDNPMFGLLGAHYYLRLKDANPATLEIILGNLNRMLPGSPDVQALRLMAARRFEKRVPEEPWKLPPMLRAGFEAVISATVDRPELVQAGSLFDQIAPRLYQDSAWTSWQPLPIQKVEQASGFSYGYSQPSAGQAVPQMPWVRESVQEALQWSKKVGQPLNLPQLARRLKLPMQAIEQAYNSLDTENYNTLASVV